VTHLVKHFRLVHDPTSIPLFQLYNLDLKECPAQTQMAGTITIQPFPPGGMIVITISHQRNLLEDAGEQPIESGAGGIFCLQFTRDFVDPETHNTLLAEIDHNPWLRDLSRRVQHYGYRYDYKARGIDLSM
jgi:hypothetical protein